MGVIYRGKDFVGEVVGNDVYTGFGLTRTFVGSIENGTVYSGHSHYRDHRS